MFSKFTDSLKAIALDNKQLFLEEIEKLPSGYPHLPEINEIKLELSE